MKDILVYSFTHTKIRNISCEVMNELKHVDRFAIDCTTNEIGLKQTADLLSLITDVRYKYILGNRKSVV